MNDYKLTKEAKKELGLSPSDVRFYNALVKEVQRQGGQDKGLLFPDTDIAKHAKIKSKITARKVRDKLKTVGLISYELYDIAGYLYDIHKPPVYLGRREKLIDLLKKREIGLVPKHNYSKPDVLKIVRTLLVEQGTATDEGHTFTCPFCRKPDSLSVSATGHWECRKNKTCNRSATKTPKGKARKRSSYSGGGSIDLLPAALKFQWGSENVGRAVQMIPAHSREVVEQILKGIELDSITLTYFDSHQFKKLMPWNKERYRDSLPPQIYQPPAGLS